MKVYLGLGSNIGNRSDFLAQSILMIEEDCHILERSEIYETDPVGYLDQDKFLNAVVLVETNKDPQELLTFISNIEKNLNRERLIPNGPRTIDIDILFYGDQIINEENLIVPHPHAHERVFVLEPVCDIDQNMVHPILGKTMKELLEDIRK